MLDNASMRYGVVVGVGLVLGCGPQVGVPEAERGTTGDVTTSTSATGMGSTTWHGEPEPPTTGDDTSTSVATSVTTNDFVDGGPDFGTEPVECSIWDEDCPRGEKCMPWANDGGTAWNATRCSPIASDPNAPGDPCTVQGNGVSGLDDCELHSMCWDVDPATSMGTCISFCVGTEQAPTCEDPDTQCSISNEGVLSICLPTCDPILQDCGGNVCAPWNEGFTCFPMSPGETQVGASCQYLDECEAGLACIAGAAGCAASTACCTPYCSIVDADPPCLLEDTCVPWFEEGEAPAGYGHVGICTAPG
jgi:hypothetical protein